MFFNFFTCIQVYIADTFGNGLIVYHNGNLKRFESSTFNLSANARNFSLGESTQQFVAGIMGMSLSPKLFAHEPRFLFFRPLTSFGLFAINVANLKKQTRLDDDITIFGKRNIFSSQVIGQVFSQEGTLFMGLSKEMAIACYNRYNDLTENNIVSFLP